MTDVEYELSRRLEDSQKFAELLDFGRIQGGRRLVEYEDVGINRNAPGNFDQMLVGDGEVSAVSVDVQAASQPGYHRPGLFAHRCAVDHAEV